MLFVQATVSFFHLALLPALYFACLPKDKVFKTFDRRFSLFLFAAFLFLTFFEQVSVFIFWDEFSCAFNFIAVDYLIYTKEVVGNIMQSYPVFTIIGIIAALAALTACLFRNALFPEVPPPSVKQKVAALAGLIALCVLSADIKLAEKGENRYNNEIAKDGLYSLFSAFIKNELNYPEFYLTRSQAENLAFLKQRGAVFNNGGENFKSAIEKNRKLSMDFRGNKPSAVIKTILYPNPFGKTPQKPQERRMK